MPDRFINTSKLNADIFLSGDYWLYNTKINHYDLATILWNLALLLVPYLAYRLISGLWRRTSFKTAPEKIAAAALGFLWLIFIPNAAYIMSEVRHLNTYCPDDTLYNVCAANLWTVFFFFAYSLVGWLVFYYLVRQMADLVKSVFGAAAGKIFVQVLIPVAALGTLLGLINRWNSWEIWSSPAAVLESAKTYFTDWTYFRAWLGLTVFLHIFYWSGGWLLKRR